MAALLQRSAQAAQAVDRSAALEGFRAAFILAAMISLAWLAARWTWLLVPIPASAPIPVDALDTRSELFAAPLARVDIQQLRAQSLFGHAARPTSQQPHSPPPAPSPATPVVKLQLIGVVYSDNPDKARAIIRAARKPDQALYRIGDELPGSTDSLPTTLAAVERRQVRILRGESEEVLELHLGLGKDRRQPPSGRGGAPPASTPETAADVQVVDRRRDRIAVEIAGRHARQLLQNPSSLDQLISYQVARRGNGELIGFSIRPKKNAQDFYRLGLRTGDVITAVNGVELDSYAALSQARDTLQGAAEASVLVLRRKKVYNILLGLR